MDRTGFDVIVPSQKENPRGQKQEGRLLSREE
jgi:hypothetical protein